MVARGFSIRLFHSVSFWSADRSHEPLGGQIQADLALQSRLSPRAGGAASQSGERRRCLGSFPTWGGRKGRNNVSLHFMHPRVHFLLLLLPLQTCFSDHCTFAAYFLTIGRPFILGGPLFSGKRRFPSHEVILTRSISNKNVY